MATYEQIPIRMSLSVVSNPPYAPIDSNTGLPAQFWRNQSVSVQVGVFDAFGNAVDLSNLATAQLLLFSSPTSPTALLAVEQDTIIPVITSAGWQNGTQQQITFDLSAGATDLGLNGETSAQFWLVVRGTTSGGSTLNYGAGYVTVYNPGAQLPVPNPGIVSYNAQATTAGNFTVTPTSLLHKEYVAVNGDARSVSCIIATSGLTAGCVVEVEFVFATPLVAGVNITIRNALVSGTVIGLIQTDGFQPNANYRCVYDGSVLKPLALQYPAFSSGVDSSGVDSSITSFATLAAIPTTVLTPPVIKVWIDSTDLLSQTWILKAGSDATIAGSVQRPDDFNPATNAKIWYRAG